MEFRPKLKAVVVGVSMALFASSAMAGGWGAPSQGDSGQGVDTVLGNGLNVTGLDLTVGQDPEGLGPYRSPAAHTPTGALYSVPWMEPANKGLNGSVELGVINTSGDNNAAKLIEYRDLSSGVILNNFNVGAEGDDHRYFKVFGGGVGREDQYYGAEMGVYNDWRVRGFYNETPHVFTTTARLIWNGASSSYLSLKPGQLKTNSETQSAVSQNASASNNAAANINTALRAAVQSAPDDTLKLIREKGGIRFDKVLPNNWSFYANATTEKRTGGRTFGQTGGGFPGAGAIGAINGNGQPIQVVEPIDYRSTDIRTGVSWADDHNAFNASVAVSLFQDSIKRVLWENPDVNPFQNGFTNGLDANGSQSGILNRHVQSFTTPPDNQAYYLNLDYSHNFDGFWNAQLVSSLSYGIQKQDDQLQPYTSTSGVTAAITAVNGTSTIAQANTLANDLRYWNSKIGPNGLPTMTRQSAGLQNNVTDWAETLNLQPTDALSLNAKWHYYNFDAKNDYLACNPSLTADMAAALGTGVLNCNPASSVAYAANLAGGVYTTANYPLLYGYAVEDGNSVALAGGQSSGLGQGGVPRSFHASFRQTNLSFGGDYKISRTQSFNANVEEESVWRQGRERDRSDEAKLKLGYVNRDILGGTLRASYEYNNRTGTEWKADAYMDVTCPVYSAPGGAAICRQLWFSNAAGVVGAAPGTTRIPVEGTKYDLSDRKQNILVARYNTMLTDTLDVMLTGRVKRADYPNPGPYEMGLGKRDENTLSLDVNWQPSTTTAFYGYATFQTAPQEQTSVNAIYSNCTQATFLAGQCSAALGGASSLYGNLANAGFFRFKSEDKNTILGLGFSHAVSFARFDGNYQYTRTRNSIDYNVWGNGTTALAAGAVPFKFPDMTYDRSQLNLNVTVPLDAKIAVRGSVMYEKADVADWHYDGLSAVSNATGIGRYYLDGGPAQSYSATTVGLLLQYKL